MQKIQSYYQGKRVLVTGHTGFKGAWLSQVLLNWGANVFGYSLLPPTNPNLYELLHLDKNMDSQIADIRNYECLQAMFQRVQPEIVFHLAAQPIVKEGYRNPVDTYATNVMGTVHMMECIRMSDCVQSVVNITTDKVYDNQEWCWGYRETDCLDGQDPYANSKSCSELVTHSYVRSFFQMRNLPVSTMRAGNVIGGGDFAKNRIVPDCIRSVLQKQPIFVRNPNSIRPYQYVLEPIMAYLMVAMQQADKYSLSGSYNIGPDEKDCITTGELASLFCDAWGEDAHWIYQAEEDAPHEANFLRLDCSKLKSTFGWKPKWNVQKAVQNTVQWVKTWQNHEDVSAVMNQQIEEYLEDMKG